MNTLGSIAGMKVVSSQWATEDDGYEDKEIMVKRGGFWERIFETDPTLHLWDDYKPVTIKVPKRKPAMYSFQDMIIAHPDIIDRLTKELIKVPDYSTSAASAISNFSDKYREYINIGVK